VIERRFMTPKKKNKKEPIRLLIVDDEVGFANVLSKRLFKRDISSVQVNSGSEAIQALRGQDFDLALLDLKMEDMNGIEVLIMFKRMVPEMPVIMLTGHGCEESAKEGLSIGAYDYLIKPCKLEDLISKVYKAVSEDKA